MHSAEMPAATGLATGPCCVGAFSQVRGAKRKLRADGLLVFWWPGHVGREDLIMAIAALNALPEADLRAKLAHCCHSATWVDAVAAARAAGPS